jgi:membrane protein implicated in regulation of membrane protease activity
MNRLPRTAVALMILFVVLMITAGLLALLFLLPEASVGPVVVLTASLVALTLLGVFTIGGIANALERKRKNEEKRQLVERDYTVGPDGELVERPLVEEHNEQQAQSGSQ